MIDLFQETVTNSKALIKPIPEPTTITKLLELNKSIVWEEKKQRSLKSDREA